jgi:hypothetical protein
MNLRMARNFARVVFGYFFSSPKREFRSFYLHTTRLSDRLVSTNPAGQPIVNPFYLDDGLTTEEATTLTDRIKKHHPSRFFDGSLTIVFRGGVDLCFPHTSLPIEPGITSLGVEMAGKPGAAVVEWLWGIARDCRFAFCDYSAPTALVAAPDERMMRRWKRMVQLQSLDDLQQWLVFKVPSRAVF